MAPDTKPTGCPTNTACKDGYCLYCRYCSKGTPRNTKFDLVTKSLAFDEPKGFDYKKERSKQLLKLQKKRF